MTKSRYTLEEIIECYSRTGSIWKTGKELGLAGQTVHDRLRVAGVAMNNQMWTEDELLELEELASHMTIGQIANRLGRTYNSIAIKISRNEFGSRFGNNQKKKLPRNGLYTKDKIKLYASELEQLNIKITTFARQKGLAVEALINAIQREMPDWWETWAAKNAAKSKTNCPYCMREFWPMSGKQIYCARKCAADARTDASYFGGKRRNTIGLAEKQCQLCKRIGIKGLSSHHALGKENDPENELLIALCPGCHHIVTILGGRNFAGDAETWESLIQLVMIRKNGHDANFKGVFCSVEIEPLDESDFAQ